MLKRIESPLGHLRSPASPWKAQVASSPGDGPEFPTEQSQTLHVESSSLTRQASLYDPSPPYEALQQQSIADAGYNPPSAPQRVYHNDHGQLDQLLQGEGPLTFPRPISTQPKEYAASSTYDTGSSSGNRSYRDPSTPSVVKERGFQLCSILKFLGDSANVLDPPPPCFDRPVPPSIPDQDFPNMTVQSASYDVEDGFPRLLPACVLQPHPFFTHDIPEEAWFRFLADLKSAGRLTVKDTLSLGLPLLAHPKMKAVPAKQLDAKHQAIGHYVESWNTYFFRPRKMEVALLQGDQIINGTKGDSSSIHTEARDLKSAQIPHWAVKKKWTKTCLA
ncbi:hypothetical protein GLOTRDRAFT_96666 [Gloeophyllum trabeum ATCC 11539]|uniref:Uncharacterized protein n=1 Tax=Gloeophyllum trabeum (strain ATCC 11539 / FP-39264 / Madison 617) TaxID=670483 RepID=S7RA45_GLOTA|nr:uncharacterized protein GLOTRDRAFT_96666 [Gloeophyllum trabeum ATCC 11539]EPQ51130.1 hypothetical protein GLOTRDRAFT_96666 [Gloeophyllum trabeum ATCC 11539]